MTTPMKPQRGLDAIKPYVPGKADRGSAERVRPEDVIKLASNENPLGPPPKTVAALKEALRRLNFYPDGQSYYLRQALASRLGVKPEQVTVGQRSGWHHPADLHGVPRRGQRGDRQPVVVSLSTTSTLTRCVPD